MAQPQHTLADDDADYVAVETEDPELDVIAGAGGGPRGPLS
ncbi:hypothetical protein [Amycolatopsis benzoatilytica]|nr:hypothetical protein [Amycolatopsis benzoatilytica]